MINNERNEANWQQSFVAMLPEIQQKLRLAFCRLDHEAREDAIEEGIVHSLLAYLRLHEQGRAEVATASSLAWYSSRHVKRGRPAGGQHEWQGAAIEVRTNRQRDPNRAA